MKNNFFFGCIILSFFIFFSCDKNKISQKYFEINEKKWTYANAFTFETEIKDTNQLYNIFFQVRHTNLYAFNNLWILVKTKYPDGKTYEKRVELVLSDERGNWVGNCSSDICDAKIPFQYDARFNKKGKYYFIIEQNMRKNPLDEILAIGLRVEISDSKKG